MFNYKSASIEFNTHAFAQSILNADVEGIAILLSDEGNYEIQDAQLKVIQVGKTEFIQWIIKRRIEFTHIKQLNFQITTCNQTSSHKPVILFNDGHFPFIPWFSNYGLIYGYRLSFNLKNEIQEVTFCDHFDWLDKMNFENAHVGYFHELLEENPENFQFECLKFLSEMTGFQADYNIGGWENCMILQDFQMTKSDPNIDVSPQKEEWDPDSVPF